MEITTTVEHTTEKVGDKEYPLTITRQVGRQTIIRNGEQMEVTEVTIFDSPQGQSRCYTKAPPDWTEEERAEGRRRIQKAVESMYRALA